MQQQPDYEFLRATALERRELPEGWPISEVRKLHRAVLRTVEVARADRNRLARAHSDHGLDDGIARLTAFLKVVDDEIGARGVD